MDALTLIVVGVIFCALIVSVFMVAYRYNSMNKEIRNVGVLVKKQLRAQSSLNAKVLESVDRQEEGQTIPAAPIGTPGAVPSDHGVILDMLKEIIERLDDMDVVLAEHLSSIDDEKKTIPPVCRNEKHPHPVREDTFRVESAADVSAPQEEGFADSAFIPREALVEEGPSSEGVKEDAGLPEPPPGLVQTIGHSEAPSETQSKKSSLPPLFTEEKVSDKTAREKILDKTVVRCPSCSRQLPYDALKIQDEQTCPYCNETFRSNDYLLALINEGASVHKTNDKKRS